MTMTAAAILIVVWPGQSVPMQPYPTRAVCKHALDQLRQAGHDLAQWPGVSDLVRA